jgi:hypothetical protein
VLALGVAPAEVDELPRKPAVEEKIREEVCLVGGISPGHAGESVLDEASMSGPKLARPDVLGAHFSDVLGGLDLKQGDGADGRAPRLGQLLVELLDEGRSETPLSGR